jgi:hypothetical protein
MPIERFPATVDAGDVAAALERDGCAIVERVAPRETLERALGELTAPTTSPAAAREGPVR